ncbi:pyocin activator PrtN family protein [Nostoc favosum]|uniref:Pyocin activator PrtN family protein n=3 Tax=Bacteria TaxID=2 RepID=A0ABS8IIY8_9NOSO|nr:pyocin activator PrtN family protein [Nostoc favosum CHAB5714]
MKHPNADNAKLNTSFLLLAQYGPMTIIPVEILCRDFFTHLTVEKFLRKVSLGEIVLPLLRLESSQRSARGVHLQDFADYLDARRAEALREYKQLHG